MITREQLIAALETQRTSGKMLGGSWSTRGVLTESQLVSALATQIGLPFVDLSDTVLDGSAVSRLPGAVCRRHHVLPLGSRTATWCWPCPTRPTWSRATTSDP